jgi:glycosyltransferase involved in cell wall biosynthesis
MLAEIANGLTRKGHDVTLLMPSGGVVEYPVSAKIKRTENTRLHESDYPVSDVIVSNYYLTVPAAQAASERGKGTHVRFSLCYEPAFLADNQNSFRTYNATKHVIVLSTWQQRLIQLLHGIRGEVVPVGVQPIFSNIHIRRHDRLRVSAVLREPEGFAHHRNQETLLRELRNLQQKYSHVETALITPPGEMARSPALQQLRATMGALFYTPANDMELRYHYNQAHIFVTSSMYEAANLPGLEAMRCGAALAAINSGGNEDYCKHNVNCLLSYQYEQQLGIHLQRLVENSALRNRLAKAGEAEALRWTWRHSVDAFERATIRMRQSRGE